MREERSERLRGLVTMVRKSIFVDQQKKYLAFMSKFAALIAHIFVTSRAKVSLRAHVSEFTPLIKQR